MFSLIITVISIALVAALAVSTLYFGGDAFNSGSEKAKASTLVAQSQQIDGANTIYRSENAAYASAIGDLTPDYLASLPTTTFADDYSVGGADDRTVLAQNVAPAVCDEVNSQVEYTSSGGTGTTLADAETLLATAGVPYGCEVLDDTSDVFFFSPD